MKLVRINVKEVLYWSHDIEMENDEYKEICDAVDSECDEGASMLLIDMIRFKTSPADSECMDGEIEEITLPDEGE